MCSQRERERERDFIVLLHPRTSIFHSVCLSLSLSICLSVCLPACLSLSLSHLLPPPPPVSFFNSSPPTPPTPAPISVRCEATLSVRGTLKSKNYLFVSVSLCGSLSLLLHFLRVCVYVRALALARPPHPPTLNPPPQITTMIRQKDNTIMILTTSVSLFVSLPPLPSAC